MLLRISKTKETFVFLCCVWLMLSGCSQSAQISQNSRKIEANSLISRPALALSLSQAIVHGMRRLMKDLLISEDWFEDMDISVLATNGEILNARITDFKMHDSDASSLFTAWKIYLVANERLEHITSFVFKSTDGVILNSDTASKRDSLFLDIPQSTFKSLLDENRAPANIQIVYWRDLSKRDKVASLHMILDSQAKYSIKM